MPPEEVIWRYSKKQIVELFKQIQKREIKEVNLRYKMIRASRAQNAPDKFLGVADFKENEASDGIGVASDNEIKNYNPNLKLRR